MFTVFGFSEVVFLSDLAGQVFNHGVFVVDYLLVDFHLLVELGNLRFEVFDLFKLLLGRLSLCSEQPAIHCVEQPLSNLISLTRCCVQFPLQAVDLFA